MSGGDLKQRATDYADGRERSEGEREWAQGDLDRRVAGEHGQQEDGSGEWGRDSDSRGFSDRANHYLWSRVALAAETLGMPNAARHMRHYLGNTGTELTVTVDNMLRDMDHFNQRWDELVEEAKMDAQDRVLAMSAEQLQSGTSFTLEGQRGSSIYCDKSVSADWFYAIGGFTHWYTAEVRVSPPAQEGGPVQIEMTIRLHIRDRYNWDGGKSVTIGGITVTDEQLGQLHRVGLAQEFDITGVSSARSVTFTSDSDVSQGNPAAPVGGDRDGNRSDPTRSRGRHFNNVRGSQ